MAGKKAGAPSRSEFIRNTLANNRKASFDEVNEAWKKAGNTGVITRTLYHQVKSKSGFSRGRKRRGRKRGEGAAPTAAVRPASNTYFEIEISLERLVAQAESIANKQLADALRSARRLASAKLL